MQENGEEGGEGKDGKDADPSSPRKCDIIIISGRREKCEAAKEALQALVPVTIEVEVPFDLHRYIIGQKELEALIKNLDNVVEDSMVVDPKHHRHFVIRRGQSCVRLQMSMVV